MTTQHTILGLMSGSSLDGVDLAIVRYKLNQDKSILSWHVLDCDTISFQDHWKNKLAQATDLSGKNLVILDTELGILFGDMIHKFINRNNHEVDLIASHGHTIFHLPDHKTTCQIGSAAHILAKTRIPVISNFRMTDMAYGGQGAPLAPLADKYLFPEYDLFLNLGGIANLSITHPGKETAYDICGCNRFFNHYARQFNVEYDKGGQIAAAGIIREDVIERLKKWSFYVLQSPKSLDNSELDVLIHEIDKAFNYNAKDMLATYVEHFSIKIAEAFNTKSIEGGEILATGGGAHNIYFCERLRHYLDARFTLIIPEKKIINFKEAILLTLAGLRSQFNQPIFDQQNTGATQSSTGGAYHSITSK